MLIYWFSYVLLAWTSKTWVTKLLIQKYLIIPIQNWVVPGIFCYTPACAVSFLNVKDVRVPLLTSVRPPSGVGTMSDFLGVMPCDQMYRESPVITSRLRRGSNTDRCRPSGCRKSITAYIRNHWFVHYSFSWKIHVITFLRKYCLSNLANKLFGCGYFLTRREDRQEWKTNFIFTQKTSRFSYGWMHMTKKHEIMNIGCTAKIRIFFSSNSVKPSYLNVLVTNKNTVYINLPVVLG